MDTSPDLGGFPGGLPGNPAPFGQYGPVVSIQTVSLDQGNQLLWIFSIGGITGLPEAVRPFFIVVHPVIEQKGIAGTGGQKQAVVPKGEHGVVVFSKALPLGIIVVKIKVPLPTRMALDPKMIVGLQGELPTARSAFQDSLGQSDAGGDAIDPHFVL